MTNPSQPPRSSNLKNPDALFDRVVSILEQARGNVVRAVNTSMVMAYWLIGREIVQELQGGQKRAKYGEKVVVSLSARLTERYGKGFSEQGLQNFRKFYLAYSKRVEIPSPMGTELGILCLPTEEQLRLEIARERRLIESKLEEQADA